MANLDPRVPPLGLRPFSFGLGRYGINFYFSPTSPHLDVVRKCQMLQYPAGSDPSGGKAVLSMFSRHCRFQFWGVNLSTISLNAVYRRPVSNLCGYR